MRNPLERLVHRPKVPEANELQDMEPPPFEIGIPDAVILVISLIGFVVLGSLIYGIIVLRLKTRRELEAEESRVSYEDRLTQANVATLSRAERRARARHIMKQQRRQQVDPILQQLLDENEGEQEEPLLVEDEQQPEPAPQDPLMRGGPVLSRKERDKAAKAAEKAERALLEEDRREQQRIIQQQAQQRRLEKERLQAEKLEREKRQALERENEQYEEWKLFAKGWKGSMSVEDFRAICQGQKIVPISQISRKVGCSHGIVTNRIRQLLDTARISGILEQSNERFIYLSSQELEQIARNLRTYSAQHQITPAVVARIVDEIVGLGKGYAAESSIDKKTQ